MNSMCVSGRDLSIQNYIEKLQIIKSVSFWNVISKAIRIYVQYKRLYTDLHLFNCLSDCYVSMYRY